jgi:hypothetical protein
MVSGTVSRELDGPDVIMNTTRDLSLSLFLELSRGHCQKIFEMFLRDVSLKAIP